MPRNQPPTASEMEAQSVAEDGVQPPTEDGVRLGLISIEEGSRFIGGRGIYLDVFVPTNTWVCEPRIVSPERVRAWETYLYMLNGVPVNYKRLLLEPDFHGTGGYDAVLCVEVWDGDRNGWSHESYRIIPESVMRKSMAEHRGMEVTGVPSLPACFCLDED